MELPLFGGYPPADPILAEENFTGYVHVPADIVKTAACFALSVRGDSMKDAGIYHGDIAVIEQRQNADNGEIVVAMIDDRSPSNDFFEKTTG